MNHFHWRAPPAQAALTSTNTRINKNKYCPHRMIQYSQREINGDAGRLCKPHFLATRGGGSWTGTFQEFSIVYYDCARTVQRNLSSHAMPASFRLFQRQEAGNLKSRAFDRTWFCGGWLSSVLTRGTWRNNRICSQYLYRRSTRPRLKRSAYSTRYSHGYHSSGTKKFFLLLCLRWLF